MSSQASFGSYTNSPSVGIVTRTKDRPVLLRRALESVKNQTYRNWRLVVVNDGGEAASVNALLETIFPSDDRVSVIHHETSQGMEAASNAGINALDTALAAIHDDDDSWAPRMLAVCTQVLAERSTQFSSIRGIVTNINAVYETVTGNHVKIEKIENWKASRHSDLTEGFIDLSKLLVHNLFPPIGLIFDRRTCVELGMFNTELPVLGDWDFNIKLCSKYDVWVHPEALSFYHLRLNATGALGNTVVSENQKHVIYGQHLRNQWLREAIGDQGAGTALAGELRAFSAQLSRIEEVIEAHSRTGDHKKNQKQMKKSSIARFLSDLNRKRKKWL